jgi:hypothetical protein
MPVNRKIGGNWKGIRDKSRKIKEEKMRKHRKRDGKEIGSNVKRAREKRRVGLRLHVCFCGRSYSVRRKKSCYAQDICGVGFGFVS